MTGRQEVTRDEALAWAEEVRRTREQVVADLGEGRVALSEVLDRAATEPLVGRIHAVTVLQALPDWGKVTSRRALASAGIDEQAPVGELDARTLLDVFGVPS